MTNPISPPSPLAQNRWVALAFLTALYTLHVVDRTVISLVLEPIRAEFDLNDKALGALGGIAHALSFSVCVLPMGWLVDRTNRVKLLSVLLATWSALTALCGFSNGYWSLFLMRMGVGAAEAGSAPASTSLISNIFPPKERATALGIMYSSTAFGPGLVFLLGGYVAQEYGWRSVFFVCGIPGILLALVMWFLMREPARPASDTDGSPKPSLLAVAKVFFTTPAIFGATAALTVCSITVSSVWVWVAPYLMRVHDLSLAQAGFVLGVAGTVVKTIGVAGSGFLADRVAKGRMNRMWIVPSIALTCSVPIAIAMGITDSPVVGVALVLVLCLFLGSHYGPGQAAIATSAPDNMRGRMVAISQLSLNLIGTGLGPLFTGMISDNLGGENAIATALAATLSLNLVAALLFWLSLRRMPNATPDEGAAKA